MPTTTKKATTKVAKPKIKAAKVIKTIDTKKAPKVVEVTLDPRIFNHPVSEDLISQAIHVYRANSHQNTSKVKTRGELNRTTKKVYKQKGTGGARHGSKMAPTYVGGGVAFGPTGVRPEIKKLNQKMRAKSLAGILTKYNLNKRVQVISLPQMDEPKTKEVKSLFTDAKTLLITGAADNKVTIKAVANLKNINIINSSSLNPYLVSLNQHVLITSSGHNTLVERLTPLIKQKAK